MTTTIDRRKFLTYTGAAGAATGAAWVAPSVLGASTAFAEGSCQNRYWIDWGTVGNSENPTLLTTGNAGAVTFAILPAPRFGAPPMSPGDEVQMTVTPFGNVDSRSAQTNDTGFGLQNVYELTMTGSAEGAEGPYGWDVTFTWPTNLQAYRPSFSFAVVDQKPETGGYKDYVYMDSDEWTGGFDDNYVEGAGTSGNPWTGRAGVVDENLTSGNISVNTASTAGHESMTISYRGSDQYYGTSQSIGIGNISWCL